MFFLVSLALAAIDPMVISQIEDYYVQRQWPEAKVLLDQIIEENGKRSGAMIFRLRAECYTHTNRPNEALEDIERGMNSDPDEKELKNLYSISATAHILLGEVEEALADAQIGEHPGIISQAKELEKRMEEINDFYDDEKYDDCAKIIDRILPATPSAYYLLKKRLEIAWMFGESKVYEEISKKLVDEYPEDTELHFRRGVSQICSLNYDAGKKTLQHVLEMEDPPTNLSDYIKAGDELKASIKRIVNRIDKKRFHEANNTIKDLMDFGNSICTGRSAVAAKLYYLRAKIAHAEDRLEDVIKEMDQAIAVEPDSATYLLYRADTHLALKDYNNAIFDYTAVNHNNPRDTRALAGLARAQELKKKLTRVDYYAVLGLSKDASEKQIKDAYRKLAVKWHPDRFASNKTAKANAEKTMKKINKAWDVLSDPKKKEWYDNGGDMEQYQGDVTVNQPEAEDPTVILQNMFQQGGVGQEKRKAGHEQFNFRF